MGAPTSPTFALVLLKAITLAILPVGFPLVALAVVGLVVVALAFVLALQGSLVHKGLGPFLSVALPTNDCFTQNFIGTVLFA